MLQNGCSEILQQFHTSVVFSSDCMHLIFWLFNISYLCIYYIQVTDIHVSRYRGLGRVPDLKKFCDTHLTVIKPKLVIASGMCYLFLSSFHYHIRNSYILMCLAGKKNVGVFPYCKKET